MNNIVPKLLKIFNGPPDLTVNVVPQKNLLFGGAVPGIPQDSSTVTFTVQNRLSFISGPIVKTEPNTLPAFGSDAEFVLVSIGLPAGLHQVGGINGPNNFQAAISPPPNSQTIFFFGGPLPAGASIDFVIEIIGDPTCGSNLTISAEVTAYSLTPEAVKSNNRGSTTIFVVSPC